MPILPVFVIKKYIQEALNEDIGSGDLTVNAIVKPGQKLEAKINSRSECVVCGIDVARIVFEILDPAIKFQPLFNDGDTVLKDQNIAIIKGNADAVLSGERTALNFMQRMSAIATITKKFQSAIEPHKAKITDTRKNTPNFRIFEKYAVRVGGGSPHRFGLFDCVMIKDNHIKLAGSITNAVNLVKQDISHTTKIEVETETLDQVKEALTNNADIIMLDNMSIQEIKEAVALIDKKALVEASGNISLESVNIVASTCVDYISTSVITAKAGIIDIGLDI